MTRTNIKDTQFIFPNELPYMITTQLGMNLKNGKVIIKPVGDMDIYIPDKHKIKIGYNFAYKARLQYVDSVLCITKLSRHIPEFAISIPHLKVGEVRVLIDGVETTIYNLGQKSVRYCVNDLSKQVFTRQNTLFGWGITLDEFARRFKVTAEAIKVAKSFYLKATGVEDQTRVNIDYRDAQIHLEKTLKKLCS
tara:strand:+ start:3112 stop:3690 length:579 start_codon:yes stop_codon:yes gene_type:complete